MCNFSFSHNVLEKIYSNLEFSHLQTLSVLMSLKYMVFGKGLKLLGPLPNSSVLALSNLKAFADKFDMFQMVHIFPFQDKKHRGKGENAGYLHLLLFPNCFKKAFFPGALLKEQPCTIKGQVMCMKAGENFQ